MSPSTYLHYGDDTAAFTHNIAQLVCGTHLAVCHIDDISFNIYEGEVLGLAGESGSGKSATGRLILRLLEATSGKVEYRGRDMLAIGHPLKIHGMGNAEERQKQVLTLMEKVGLMPADFLYRKYPHQLSGGQCQRVVLARALVTNRILHFHPRFQREKLSSLAP